MDKMGRGTYREVVEVSAECGIYHFDFVPLATVGH